MKQSTARKLKQVPAGYLLVGVEPHQKRHAAVVMTQDAQAHSKFKFANSKRGYEEAVERAGQEMVRTGCRGVMFAIETASHYWRNPAYFLEDRGIPFRLINQFTLKCRREGRDLDRHKDDFRDAEMAAELLRTGEFTETRQPQGVYAELRAAYNAYRRLVKERARTTNLLKGLLDGLFPEFIQVFKDATGETALSVLSICPMPRVMAQMTEDDFACPIRGGHQGRLMRKKLFALHHAAGISLGIGAGAQSVAMEIHLLAEKLRLIDRQIGRIEETLTRLVDETEEGKYLLSIRGLGYISVASMLAELGPFQAYRSAKQLVKMAGTNPPESESAGTRGSHTPLSKKGRPGLRYCGWTAAIPLLRHNQDFRAWAQRLRQRPVPHHPLKGKEVVGAALNRRLRLAYALVKNQTCYRLPQPAEVAA